MLAVANFLIQGIGLVAGVYVAITGSWQNGLLLVAIVLLGHVVFTKLSNLTMLLHQKLFLQKDELVSMALYARLGSMRVPLAWRIIALCYGISYLVLAAAVIVIFVYRAEAI